MDTLTSKRAYHKRRAGDVVNGAILLESVDGHRWKMKCKVLTVNGKSGTVAEWAEIMGIKRETISRRIKNGKSAYEAVSRIPKIGNNQFSRPEMMDIPERMEK